MKQIRKIAAQAIAASCVALASLVVLPVAVHANEKVEGVTASSTGEVRRVDTKAGKVTIKHGPISALELPAITLVYQAAPVLLVDIAPGDRVRFTATRLKDAYVVTEISK
jgi:Cu(I)/Ag(I) efflux system protein CusF